MRKIVISNMIALALAAGPAVAARGAPVIAPGYRLETVVPPSVTHGIHGLAIGPDQALYAGDILGLTVWRIDIATGATTAFVGAPAGMADDLAFGPDGLLVWSHIYDGLVYSRTPDGVLHVIAKDLPGINSVGFSADGRLFATQLVGEDRLWELDPAGVKPPRLLRDKVEGLNGFAIDDRGVLWGPEGKRGTIISLDLASGERRVIADGFAWPTGVKIDTRGRIFVNDLAAGTITEVDRTSGSKRLVHQFLPGIDNLAIGPDNQIFVSSPGDNSIYAVDPDTGAVRTVRRGFLSVAGGLAVVANDPGDDIYIADLFDWKHVAGRTGAVTPRGRIIGEPRVTATNVTVSGDRLLLTHWYDGTLRIVDRQSGKTIRQIAQLPGIQDAVELPDGRLLVSLRDLGQVVAIDANDKRRILVAGLSMPVGLALSGRKLLVAEAGSGNIAAIDVASGARTVLAAGLRQPEGLAAAADGTIFVVEAAAARLTTIDRAGRRKAIASQLPLGIDPGPGMPRTWIINDVAIGARGAIYVTADQTGALLRLVPSRKPYP